MRQYVNGSENDSPESSITLRITNVGAGDATVIVLNAYTGDQDARPLSPGQTFEHIQQLERFHGWYDLIIKVEEDPTFQQRLARHVENGKDSFSDPALGGLVTLKT